MPESLDDEKEEGTVAQVKALAIGDGPASHLVVIIDRGHLDPRIIGERGVMGALHDLETFFVGDRLKRDFDRNVGGPFSPL